MSPAATRSVFDLAEEQEQLVVLDRAEAVDDRHDALAGVVRLVGEQPGDEEFGERGGGRHRVFGDARFAVDAQAQGHLPGGDVEEGFAGAGEGAAVEGDAEGTGAVVGPDGQPFDVVQVQSGFGGGAGDLEDRQVPGDAAALVDLVQGCAGDVVGDQDGAGLDAFGVEPELRLAEVEDVPGVVAVAEQDAAAGVGGFGHPVDLSGGGGREHVPARRGGGQAGPDQAGEGRVVAGAAADHQGHLPGGDLGGADDAAVHPGDVAAVGGDKAVQCLIREVGWVVEDLGHGSSLNPWWK